MCPRDGCTCASATARSCSRAGGKEPVGLLAALVLGQAMVPLPASLRGVFRAASLSHALAASGFHLSVLLGVVLLLSRRAPALIRWLSAFGAMGLIGLFSGRPGVDGLRPLDECPGVRS